MTHSGKARNASTDRVKTVDGSGYIDLQNRFAQVANVLDFGAMPYVDGGSSAGDSTEAFEAALATGKPVYVPAALGTKTVYDAGDVLIPDGGVLFGDAGMSYSTSINSAIILRKSSSATNTIIDLSGSDGFRIESLCIDGVDRSVNGVSAITQDCNQGIIRNVTTRNCARGFGGQNGGYYMRSTRITTSTSTQNTTGIADIIDSVVNCCTIAGSHSDGINLSAGNGDNTFIGNKIEWNQGHGIQAFNSSNLNIIGGIIDRNYKSGIYFNGTTNSTLNGTILRRNGRNAVSGEKSHILFNGADNVIISGIVTVVGADDGGGGPTTPENVFETQAACSNLVITGSDLTGFVSGARTGTPNTSYTFFTNVGMDQAIGGYDISADQGRLYQSRGSDFSISAGATDTISLSASPVAQYSRRPMTLRVYARNSSTGGSYSASFDLVLRREGGGASILASPAFGELASGDTTIGGAGAAIDINFSNIATDGSTFDAEVTNNTASNTLQIFLELS